MYLSNYYLRHREDFERGQKWREGTQLLLSADTKQQSGAHLRKLCDGWWMNSLLCKVCIE